MTLDQSIEYIGGLSKTEKMPFYSYSIPASKCKTGKKLAKIKNSVCSKCYANKFRYLFGNVKNALMKRYNSLNKKFWVREMTNVINNLEYSGHFRWQDAGDIQSIKHLDNICAIAKNLPHIKFWLPSREYKIVSDYIKTNKIPDNLIIRLSALMIDGAPPTLLAKRLGVLTSGVSSVGFTCPASKQGNKCLTCRACWSKEIENINYKLH